MSLALSISKRGIGFGNLGVATRGRVPRRLAVALLLTKSVSPSISSAVALALTASLSVSLTLGFSASSTVLLARTDIASAFVAKVPTEITLSLPAAVPMTASVEDVPSAVVQPVAVLSAVQALATAAAVPPQPVAKGAEPTKLMFVPAAGLTPVAVSGFTGVMRVAAVEQRLLVAPEPIRSTVEEA